MGRRPGPRADCCPEGRPVSASTAFIRRVLAPLILPRTLGADRPRLAHRRASGPPQWLPGGLAFRSALPFLPWLGTTEAAHYFEGADGKNADLEEDLMSESLRYITF
ncbi:hypothetical protein ZIOFF_066636 [Zingiber officinale]|uniref:Uncharacterized protein n=1 Tax=Zingiber officinale TaxID=94328 RepID=A0A8J5EYP4_ZINOF|nr:hypothetical protein ZIOFF_066636 [Zingiber officinale]